MWARIFCTIGNVPLSTLSLKGCCVSSNRLRQLDSKQGVGFQLIDWPWYWPFCKNLAFLLLSCNRINFSVYLQGKYLLYIIFCIFKVFYDMNYFILWCTINCPEHYDSFPEESFHSTAVYLSIHSSLSHTLRVCFASRTVLYPEYQRYVRKGHLRQQFTSRFT